MVLAGPSLPTSTSASMRAAPVSSISLPKIAPSTNSARSCARKLPRAGIMICVSDASAGVPATSTATTAASGAAISTLTPR
jgi:hypothetical protein